jgi:hypothetical protein
MTSVTFFINIGGFTKILPSIFFICAIVVSFDGEIN